MSFKKVVILATLLAAVSISSAFASATPVPTQKNRTLLSLRILPGREMPIAVCDNR